MHWGVKTLLEPSRHTPSFIVDFQSGPEQLEMGLRSTQELSLVRSWTTTTSWPCPFLAFLTLFTCYAIGLYLCVCSAAGNRMPNHAKSLGIPHAKVCHQNKEWPQKIHKGKSHGISKVAGTQIADRGWLSLKQFIPRSFPRRLGCNRPVIEHPELKKLVQQFMWRKLLGPCKPSAFLAQSLRSWKKNMKVSRRWKFQNPNFVNRNIKIDTAQQRHEHFQEGRMQFVPQLSEGRAPSSLKPY